MDLGFRVIWDWDKHTEIRVCESRHSTRAIVLSKWGVSDVH